MPAAATVLAAYHDTDTALDALAHLRDLDGERLELVDAVVVHRDEGAVELRSDRSRVVDAVDRAISSPLSGRDLESFGRFIPDGADLLVAIAEGPSSARLADEVEGADQVVSRTMSEVHANVIELFLEPPTAEVGFFD